MLFKHSNLTGLRLSILILLSMVLMSVDHKQHNLERVHSALSAVVAPLQYIVSLPVGFIDSLHASFSSQRKLIDENANLRAELLLLNAKLQTILSLKKENEQLKALLQSTAERQEDFTVAQVLAVSSEPFVNELVINKGRADKVYVGQPVLGAHGLMGQIIEVGPLNSRVMLVVDNRNAVPVKNERNGARGIVVGTNHRNELALVNRVDASNIKVGDLLTTSGLGQHYPEGYPVGVVKEISHKSGESFVAVSVSPSAYLFRNRQVLLVWHSAAAPSDKGGA